jgi:spore coat polysaccharide biosynthesis protein SpsF
LFGDEYTSRNPGLGEDARRFWDGFLERHHPSSVLEIGCNLGANLRIFAEKLPAQALTGVDLNQSALTLLQAKLPKVNALIASGSDLPFDERTFDLVMTVGVLIHQDDSTLPMVMHEMYRCSKRHIFMGEYFAAEPVEIPYRGQRHALFKRDYGGIFQDQFPDVRIVEEGFLSKDDGWDNVTWWLFEKPT